MQTETLTPSVTHAPMNNIPAVNGEESRKGAGPRPRLSLRQRKRLLGCSHNTHWAAHLHTIPTSHCSGFIVHYNTHNKQHSIHSTLLYPQCSAPNPQQNKLPTMHCAGFTAQYTTHNAPHLTHNRLLLLYCFIAVFQVEDDKLKN